MLLRPLAGVVQGVLRGAPLETKLRQGGIKLGVPGPWRLTQPQDLLFRSLDDEPWRLLDIDGFS